MLTATRSEALKRLYGDSTGHVDHEVAAFASFAVEICRPRDASDLRDKVIAMLGLASKYEASTMLLLPDYTKTTAQTYTKFAWYVIEATGSLAMFSMELSPSREVADIPSWVSDYSIPGRGASETFAYREDFHVCGGYRIARANFTADDCIQLRGWHLDNIIDEYYPPKVGAARNWYRCMIMAKQHFNSASPGCSTDWAQEFLRTVTADTLSHLSQADLRTNLWPTLAALITDWAKSHDNPEPEEANLRTRAMDVYALLVDSALRPNLTILLEDTTTLDALMLQHAQRNDVVRHLDKDGLLMNQWLEAVDQRSFIVTQNHYFGLAPSEISAQDQIWLLPGAKVPIVLRLKENGCYQLVGEAYIHGVMKGEMITSGRMSEANQQTVCIQ